MKTYAASWPSHGCKGDDAVPFWTTNDIWGGWYDGTTATLTATGAAATTTTTWITGSLFDTSGTPTIAATYYNSQSSVWIPQVQATQAHELFGENQPVPPRRPPAARQRARDLLISMLTPDQRKEFDDSQAFTLLAQSGKRYRITHGIIANIEALSRKGVVTHRLCAHPHNASELPVEDTLIAQLLHLRADEAGFLRGANRHPMRAVG